MTVQHNFLLLDESGRTHQMDGHTAGQAGAALTRLLVAVESRRRDDGRMERNIHGVALRRMDSYAQAIAGQLNEARGVRSDSFSPAMGAFNPRDMTHRFRQVMEERLPPTTALASYPVSTEIPPGAANYEMSRSYGSGEAVVYNGGNGKDIVPVSIGQTTTRQKIVTLLAKWEINWLEQFRANFAGLDIQTGKMRRTRRVMDEKINTLAWFGSTTWGLYGIVNHPYQDKIFSATAFDNTSDGVDILDAFSAAAWYAYSNKRTAFSPDTCTLSAKLMAYASRTYVDPGSGSSEKLLEAMKAMCPHIVNWQVAHELDDAGPAGEHGIHFSRKGVGPADQSMRLEIPMAPTLLPPDSEALSSTTFMVAMFGGANQLEVGHNLMIWFDSNL